MKGKDEARVNLSVFLFFSFVVSVLFACIRALNDLFSFSPSVRCHSFLLPFSQSSCTLNAGCTDQQRAHLFPPFLFPPLVVLSSPSFFFFLFAFSLCFLALFVFLISRCLFTTGFFFFERHARALVPITFPDCV